jgi:hypothetical protein
MIKLVTEQMQMAYETPANFTGIMYYENGDEEHLKNGLFHREDGPAFIRNDGYQAWCIEGVFHRLEGPARIWPSGRKEYWIKHKEFSKQDWEKEVAKLKNPYYDKIIEIDGKKYKLTLIEE